MPKIPQSTLEYPVAQDDVFYKNKRGVIDYAFIFKILIGNCNI